MPLYFIAFIPPSSIQDEVLEFQKELELSFGAKHAQKAPSHITIVPPFECTKETADLYWQSLREDLQKEVNDEIKVELSDFQRFNWRTLFIDVKKNEVFESFCKRVKRHFWKAKLLPQKMDKHFFVPHITIANKDLKKRDFKLAWERFKNKNYERSFLVKKISLLHLADQKWKVYQSEVFFSKGL